MKGNRKIVIPMEVYEKAEEIFRDYKDICKALGIRDPTHLIGLMCFLRIIELT